MGGGLRLDLVHVVFAQPLHPPSPLPLLRPLHPRRARARAGPARGAVRGRGERRAAARGGCAGALRRGKTLLLEKRGDLPMRVV